MLLVEQLKLRGNYPWYNLKVENSELDDNECIEFGVRTYWMRKAIVEVLEENGCSKKEILRARERMINSYHTVCVYLYKARNTEDACLLENEVFQEAKMLLPKKKGFALESQSRINEIQNNINIKKRNQDVNSEKSEKYYGLFEYLWQKLITNSYNTELFEMNARVLECMQYMGDYYLHMKYYTLAYKKLAQVLLYRYIWFGLEDNKTLDSLLRIYVVSVIQNIDECIKQIEQCVTENLFGNPENGKRGVTKQGMTDKIKMMKELMNIAKNRDEDIEKKLFNVLDE